MSRLHAVSALFTVLAALGAFVVGTGSASATPPVNPRVGTITHGVAWNDTAGHYITAHLGSSFQVTSAGVRTYYWCGVNWNSPDSSPAAASHTFQGVQCYSSANLATWAFAGTVLQPDPNNPMLTSSRIIERPKIIYNPNNNYWVMWFHDANPSYTEWKIGVAISTTGPLGPYQWVPDSDPAGFRSCGTGTGDMTLFHETDSDPDAYFVHTTTRNLDIQIQHLDVPFFACDGTVTASGLGGGREAPQLIRTNGLYYLFTSATQWWSPSQGNYRTATNLAGPWSAPKKFGSSLTAVSQGADIIPVVGSLGTTFVMLADRLQGSSTMDQHWNVNQSHYVMLPLTFSGSDVRLDYLNSWSIDTSTGLWSTTDPQPCDLTQYVDSEPGTADNVGQSGTQAALTPQAGTWGVTKSTAPTGNTTNQVYTHSTAEASNSVQTSDTTAYSNFYVQAFATLNGSEATVAGRVNQATKNSYYQFGISASGWAIRLTNNGATSVLASGTNYPSRGVAGAWYVMRLVMQGSTVSAHLSADKGATFTVLGSVSDTTLTSGTFAVGSSGGLTSFDNIGACAFPVGNPVAAPTVVARGANRQLTNASTGTPLCATTASTSGSPLLGSSCAAANTWTWEQFPENADGSGRVVSSNGLCLDVAAGNVVAGATVVGGTCYNTSASISQRWFVDELGAGVFRFRNAVLSAGQVQCVAMRPSAAAILSNCSPTDASQQFGMS